MEHTVYQFAWFFLVYSFLGWLLETALAAARKRRLINRGFLNAPFSPTYGIAAVLFAIFLPELRSAPFFLFLGGMILATAMELVTGVLLERIFGQKWWDYSQEPWNFNGYICLKYSIIWGLLSLFCMYIGDPLLVAFTDWLPRGVGHAILLVVLVLLIIDLFGSSAALIQLRGSIKEPNEVSRRWKRVSSALDNAVTRSIQRRMARAYPGLEREHLRLERQKKKEASVQEHAQASGRRSAEGCGLYKLAWIFFFTALLGDLIETIFCRITVGVWMSRSSLVYGPFSIVWGGGAVILTVLLYPYRDRRDSFLFAFGTVLGGAYEYACSVLSELMFGAIFWDYSHIPFNLGGRINLLYCFFWGIATVVWIKGIYPFLSAQIDRCPVKIGKILTWIMAAFMACNMAISALAFGRYVERSRTDLPAQTAVSAFLDRRFPDERIERIYPDAKLLT